MTRLFVGLACAALFLLGCAKGGVQGIKLPPTHKGDTVLDGPGVMGDGGDLAAAAVDILGETPTVYSARDVSLRQDAPADLSQPKPDRTSPTDRTPPDSPPAALVAPFALDFEKDNGGLIGTLDWEWGVYAFKVGKNCDYTATLAPPSAPHSGTRMWGTKLNDCYSPLNNADALCANSNLNDDSVLTLTFRIPSTMTRAKLTYWEYLDIFAGYDWIDVHVNGKSVRQVCNGSGWTQAQWAVQTIDLAALAGTQVTVDFRFMATATINLSGWYIDDISVSE